MGPIDLRYARADDRIRVTLAGEWKPRRGFPAPSAMLDELERQPRPRRVTFDGDEAGLPRGVTRLLARAAAGSDRSRWRSLACASLAVAGCMATSQPSRFYTLAPGEVREIPAFARALVRFGVEVGDGGAAAAEMERAP